MGDELAVYRKQIDQLDKQIVDLLVQRQALCDAAVTLKPASSDPRDVQREARILRRITVRAASSGLEAELAHGVWRVILAASVARQRRQLNSRNHTASLMRPADKELR